MAMTGALFLLLAAVAVRQADLTTLTGSGTAYLVNCTVRFYGQSFNIIKMAFDSGSFYACFTNDISDINQDCLYLNTSWISNKVEVQENEETLPVGMEGLLPNIVTYSDCNIQLSLMIASSTIVDIVLYDYNPQAAVSVETVTNFSPAFTLTTVTGNSPRDSWVFSATEAFDGVYYDVSGCRFEGNVMTPGSERILPDCTIINCTAAANLHRTSTCGPLEVCMGNNMCVPSTVVCTVTGSTVFDVLDRVHNVSDRCLYTLMTKDGEFKLSAGFRERRRKDVVFLDHLNLWLPEVNETMYFEQGGRVRVGDQMLQLNANAQEFYGVDLSRDETGVTAKTSYSNMTLFFDGDTAHVTVLAEPVGGLCGNVTDPSQTTDIWEMRNYLESEIGCDMQYNDTDNNTMDCSLLPGKCYLMYQDPFTACSNVTNPEPFVTACIDTTCKYPPVDGLGCQFLEAYAEACFLKSGISLDPIWRSDFGCSVVLQDGCQDQYCSHHEFCGENLGETRCLCRALFASDYKPTDAFGDPTVCMQNSATVTLAACLLWAKGIDYSALHLNDENCTGLIDDEAHMVTFSFNSSHGCGTEVMRNDSQVTFKNTIMARDSSAYSIITNHDQVEIDFSCSYTQPNTRSLSFRIRDNPVFQHIETGVWNYSVMMNTYTDPGLQLPVGESTEIQLNQRIWLHLETEGLDDDMVAVVTDSCWATNQSMPDVDPRYDLIVDGCPADETVQMEGNGLGLSSSFSFSVFEFFEDNNDNSDAIYLHCKLELCPKEESCAPNCDENPNRRRRSSRSEYADGHPALITMVWSI